MDLPAFGRFLSTLLGINAIAMVIAVQLSPPDPFTMVSYWLPLVPIVVLLSFLLAYRGGFEFLTDRL